MENPEEVLQSLDEFAKLKPKDIPRELEDYLSYVAKTGDPVYQWSIVKCLFREKLLNVITDFYETSPTIDLPPCPNVDPFNYETMKNSLLERLDSFPSAPFTVQRLCELLTTPRKEYSRADKFMRAIEKNILVVSTREPGNVRRSDNNGQAELLMNGVMDGRGIELGEAIETVSSDGVNLMHSDENEVNVTENENVPVECAGMEEIDMEEQTDHMEASNSSVWDKEQTDVSVQSEENGNAKNYDGNNGEGENKSKESSESSEVSSTDTGESRNEPAELPVVTENVTDSFSEVIPEDAPVGLDTCSSRKDELEKNGEKSDLKVDCAGSEANLQSEDFTTKDAVPKLSEETTESVPPDGPTSIEAVSESNIPSEQESVSSSSTNEDLIKISSDTETTPPVENSNTETVDGNTISETVSVVVDTPASEPVIEASASHEEETSKSDSTDTEISPIDTCAKSVDLGVSADSEATEAVAIEVTNVSPEEFTANEIMPADTSKKDSEEDAVSINPPAEVVPDEHVAGNGVTSKTEEVSGEAVAVESVVCQQDEAMEVDDITSPTVSADVDEPMDQSEQPTEGQSES